MMDAAASTPLAHREPLQAGDLHLGEEGFIGLLTLRGARDTLAKPVQQGLGLNLPGAVGDVSEAGTVQAIWIGPDEWLLVTAPGEEQATKTALQTAIGSAHHQLVDVSDHHCVIALKGPQAWQLLSKLMVIDVDPTVFTPGQAFASLVAKANAVVWRLGDDDSGQTAYRIIVRRSFADYVWCLLAEAGREWHLPAQEPIGRVKQHLPHFE